MFFLCPLLFFCVLKKITMDLHNIDNRLEAIEKALTINKRVLSVDEACTYLGMAKSYLYKLTSSGVLPYSKPHGKKIFFDREKLDSWLLSNETKSAAQKEVEASTFLRPRVSPIGPLPRRCLAQRELTG